MAEGGVGTCPQVFVVDSQASYVSVPMSEKKPRWGRAGQKFLLLLVGVALLGLVVEGCFIYSLYKKTQEYSLCKFHPLCHNLSKPQTSGQQGGIMSQVGPKESNEIPSVPPHLEQVQQRPFAQLIGSYSPKGKNNVVLWLHKDGEIVSYKMGYDNGRLLVEMDGYYYLYSKVTLNVAEECALVQHKVMKDTKAYDYAIELMNSKGSRCRNPNAKASVGEDLWNSFQAGIFHLKSGDKIFVKLDGIEKMRAGPTDNLMGAFMIFPGKIP